MQNIPKKSYNKKLIQTGEAADDISKEETKDDEGSVEESAEAAADESKEAIEEQADASEEKAQQEISEKEEGEQSEETVTDESTEVSAFQEGKINDRLTL